MLIELIMIFGFFVSPAHDGGGGLKRRRALRGRTAGPVSPAHDGVADTASRRAR